MTCRILWIIDCNRLGQSQPTMLEHKLEVYQRRFKAFGWNAIVIDGHDLSYTNISQVSFSRALSVFDVKLHALSSGDRFDTGLRFEAGRDDPSFDVVDMEAYALAKVCFFEGVPFACAKYVTDGADSKAATDWNANLPLAAEAFVTLYRDLSGRIALSR